MLRQSTTAFKNIHEAVKHLPKSKGPINILVFNQQGLPVLFVSRDEKMPSSEQERVSALGLRMFREIINSVRVFHNQDTKRLIFYYGQDVISVEQEGPFVFLITWPPSAFEENPANTNYITRLRKTLYEELT